MAELDPRYTFENFVVGPANRLASAAARRASEGPGVSYNPLFIHGPSGMGKTHLLGAIVQHTARVFPERKVEYRTAQEFLEEFGETLASVGEKEIRDRYRDMEILLQDEVHILTEQPEVQEFLLQILATLMEDGKQVVLASDHGPSEIEGLGAHLRARFEGGLIVEIGRPGYETRVAIIRKWLEIQGHRLEAGVPEAIGRFPSQTVSQLGEVFEKVLDAQGTKGEAVSPKEVLDILGPGDGPASDPSRTELGEFLDDLSDTVAAKVRAQEVPWRKLLREAAEEVEKEGFNAGLLRARIDGETEPGDLEGLLSEFRRGIERLKKIQVKLEEVGNPWPEAAHSVLNNPDQLDEAEALLASAKERARSFPGVSAGPTLSELGTELPKQVIRAAENLISTDRSEYNPLYLWSRGGAAARVALHSAGRSRDLADQDARMALTSVDGFAEEFIRALSMGVAGAWRERWWLADLLLLDGAEGLSGTERAQEELFHLLEALQRRSARVMIAADRPPDEISSLDDRLRSRLEAGLVMEIEVEESSLSLEILETLLQPQPKIEPPDPEEVSSEDRHWIRSFQPQGPAGQELPSAAREEEAVGVDGAGSAGEEVAPSKEEAWVISPEKVVLEWAILDERIVENPD